MNGLAAVSVHPAPGPLPVPLIGLVVDAIAGVALILVGVHTLWRCHVRRVRQGPGRAWVRSLALRWPLDAHNLGLRKTDETSRHRRDWLGKPTPPVIWLPKARFAVAPNGVIATVSTLHGVGLDEYLKAAPHLANAWGCVRVDASQTGPGQIRLRGFVRDPLAEPYRVTPTGQAPTVWALQLGRDDEGNEVWLPLANLSGITTAGLPGYGKTSLAGHCLAQLAPSPAVQFAILDGKVADIADGDYGPIADRCFAASGDDLDQANQVLAQLHELMRARAGQLRATRGTAQFWAHGPTEDCPLVVVIVDESHTFVTSASRKDRETCDSNVWYLTKLAKEGRAKGFLLVMITQKQTADAIPTAIRDVCQVGLSFATRTTDGAVAALGDEIRQYPDISPVTLIDPRWVGVAVTRLPGRAGFGRVRTPYVAEADVAAVVAATAGLRRPLSGRRAEERSEESA
jgi:S-DNA-T family DNA segregation ATPase FtsK/SpoIIIE